MPEMWTLGYRWNSASLFKHNTEYSGKGCVCVCVVGMVQELRLLHVPTKETKSRLFLMWLGGGSQIPPPTDSDKQTGTHAHMHKGMHKTPNPTQLLLHGPQAPLLPFLTPFFMLKMFHCIHFARLLMHGCRVIHWSMVDLPVTTAKEKWHPFFLFLPSAVNSVSGCGHVISSLLLRDGILTGFTLCWQPHLLCVHCPTCSWV